MPATYTSLAPATCSSALGRTLRVWLLGNLGGTGLLTLDFSSKYPSDLAVPLVMGLMAALLSLALVPVAWPFFAMAHRACTGSRCRILALSGVLVVFAVSNVALLHWLPIGPFSTLLSFSRLYLGAAVLAVAWLYRPRPAPALLAQPVADAGLQGWRGRPLARPSLAH